MPRHSETRKLPWSTQQMYALVADIPSYPEFLPWCAAARITRRTPGEKVERLEAEMVIGFKLFRESFLSAVELDPEAGRIVTRNLNGPFRNLASEWHFLPLGAGALGNTADQGCQVCFSIDFEFRSVILQRAVGLMFNEAMQRIVRAFEARARALHGAA